MSASSSVRARVRALFLPRGCPVTGAVGSLRGLPSFLPVEVAFALDFLVFSLRLPVRPKDALALYTREVLMVPSNPAAVHASFTDWVLPWGLSWRNSFKKLVLPKVAVASLGLLAAAFSLAAVLAFLRRLPVSFTLVLLTKVGLIVPSNPAACHASFTDWVLPWGLSWRNSFTKLVLPGVAVAVVAMRSSPGWFKPSPVSTERQNAVYGQRNSHEFQGRVESSLG